MTENPYTAPETTTGLLDHSSEEEKIRRKHLNIEASIRSLGTLYLAGGVLALLGPLGTFSSIPDFSAEPENIGYLLGSVLIPILILVMGIRLRKLSRISVIFAGIISVFGLFLFPVGTIINLLILYTLFCKKGRFVVTPEYQRIIRATPHVRYRTSPVTWALFIILLILLLLFGGFMYSTS